MKKVILSIVLLLSVGSIYAQKSNLKAAKSAAEAEKPDFAKAQSLIDEALKNPETMNDPETWNVAGQIQKAIVSEQEKKIWLKQAYDTVAFYNGTYKMTQYMLKCDSLAQIPNEKGKIKNKYRNDNAPVIKQYKGNLINGGVVYINKGDNSTAEKFFGTYVDLASAPMLQEKEQKVDSFATVSAYYGCIAAVRSKDWTYVTKYAPTVIAQGKPDEAKSATEWLTNGYGETKDTVKWVSALKDGITKYPSDNYFFLNLVNYYSSKGKVSDAQNFADEMIAKDPNNATYTFVKGYLYELSKDYENAVKYYKMSTDKKPDYAQAWSYMGRAYISRAMEIDANTSTQAKDYNRKQGMITALYGMAKPCYEKVRELKPDDKSLWLNGLYAVYYRLGTKGPQFDEIQKMYEEQAKQQ